MTTSQLLKKAADMLMKEFMDQPPPPPLPQHSSSPPPYSEYPPETYSSYAPSWHQNKQQLPSYYYQYDYSNYPSVYQGEHGAGAFLQNMWMLADIYNRQYIKYD